MSLYDWIFLEIAKGLLFFCIGTVLGAFITGWYYALKERDEENEAKSS